jgi:hypothetical protein
MSNASWSRPGTMRLLAALIFAFAIGPTVAVAGPTEDSVFAAFEAICIWPINKPLQIVGMLEDIGATPLEAQAATPFLAGESGRVWIMRDTHARVVITLTSEGVCSVFGPEAASDAVEGLVQQHFRSMKLKTEKVGSEVITVFAVTHSDPNDNVIHVLVDIKKSALASVAGTWLTAMPERVAEKELPHSPQGPCVAAAAVSCAETYTNSGKGYSVEFNSNWTRTQYPTPVDFALACEVRVCGEDTGFTANANFVAEAANLSTQDFLRSAPASKLQPRNGTTLVLSGGFRIISTHDANRFNASAFSLA